jgi:hypothetical protein
MGPFFISVYIGLFFGGFFGGFLEFFGVFFKSSQNFEKKYLFFKIFQKFYPFLGFFRKTIKWAFWGSRPSTVEVDFRAFLRSKIINLP